MVALMNDLRDRGIESFKSWPSSAFFFYPRVGHTLSYAQVDAVMPTLRQVAPKVPEAHFRNRLIGAMDVERDINVALGAIDRSKVPLHVESNGESSLGSPPQFYRPFGPDGPGYGKPYLNYLLILSAISRSLDSPLQTVVEIGSGCAIFGEILKQSDPSLQYVNVDIPPLSVIAHYYLSNVFPDLNFLSNLDIGDSGAVELGAGKPSASLSSWQIQRLEGSADLFVNAFSFQEMEPHVVRNYANHIASWDTRFVVSLNSRRGKPKADQSSVGVIEQTTSQMICDTFTSLGYEPVARHGRPFAPPQAELLILKKV